jgi:hypothetical protein
VVLESKAGNSVVPLPGREKDPGHRVDLSHAWAVVSAAPPAGGSGPVRQIQSASMRDGAGSSSLYAWDRAWRGALSGRTTAIWLAGHRDLLWRSYGSAFRKT